MRIGLLIMSIVVIAIIGTASALPEFLDSFNAQYNTKGTKLDTCDLCHIAGKPQRGCDELCHIPNKPQKIDPINLNPYGKSLKVNLNKPISKALIAIEKIDSAGDGVRNIDKIRNLTLPGDKIKGDKKNQTLLSMLLGFIEPSS